MKIGVGIVEQCGRLGEGPDEDREPGDQRPGWDKPAPYTRVVSGLARQNDHVMSPAVRKGPRCICCICCSCRKLVAAADRSSSAGILDSRRPSEPQNSEITAK